MCLLDGSSWSYKSDAEGLVVIQEVGDTRNIKHLLRKVTGSEWNQPKTEVSQAVCHQRTRKRQGCPCPLEPRFYQILLWVMDMALQDIMFARLVTMWLYSDYFLSPYSFFLEWECLHHCTVELFNFLFDGHWVSQLRVCLMSQNKLWTWIFLA